MKPSKSYLNENEAAEFLGVSATQLRTLIRSRVSVEEADMSKVGITQFQPADLLLLRFLIGQSRGETPSFETAQLAESVAETVVLETAGPSGDGESGSTLAEVHAVPATSVAGD